MATCVVEPPAPASSKNIFFVCETVYRLKTRVKLRMEQQTEDGC